MRLREYNEFRLSTFHPTPPSGYLISHSALSLLLQQLKHTVNTRILNAFPSTYHLVWQQCIVIESEDLSALIGLPAVGHPVPCERLRPCLSMLKIFQYGLEKLGRLPLQYFVWDGLAVFADRGSFEFLEEGRVVGIPSQLDSRAHLREEMPLRDQVERRLPGMVKKRHGTHDEGRCDVSYGSWIHFHHQLKSRSHGSLECLEFLDSVSKKRRESELSFAGFLLLDVESVFEAS